MSYSTKHTTTEEWILFDDKKVGSIKMENGKFVAMSIDGSEPLFAEHSISVEARTWKEFIVALELVGNAIKGKAQELEIYPCPYGYAATYVAYEMGDFIQSKIIKMYAFPDESKAELIQRWNKLNR